MAQATNVTLFKRVFTLFWLSMFVSACVMQPPAPLRPELSGSVVRGAQLHGQLMAVASQQVVSIDTFVATVATAQLIALGEEHDHPAIQAFALQLLQALAQRRAPHLALAMEFLERDMQPAVDAYLAGVSDATTLQQQISATPAFMQYYFPLLHYARQTGIPVLAMNLPRRLARHIAREGLTATLDALGREERSYMPTALSPITPQYRTYFQQEVVAAHPLPAAQTERFLEASHVKDDTMAETLHAFLTRTDHSTILAIAGRFHFDYGLAIPARLQQRLPTLALQRLTTMSVEADEAVDLEQLAHAGIADYVWFAPPHPAQTSRR